MGKPSSASPSGVTKRPRLPSASSEAPIGHKLWPGSNVSKPSLTVDNTFDRRYDFAAQDLR